MTVTPEIPEEAVLAVARQVFYVERGVRWEFDWADNAKRAEARQRAMEFARSGLAAALPHLQPSGAETAVDLEALRGDVLEALTEVYESGAMGGEWPTLGTDAVLDLIPSTTFELGRALGRKEAGEEIAVAIEGEPSERKRAQIARNIALQPSRDASKPLTAPPASPRTPKDSQARRIRIPKGARISPYNGPPPFDLPEEREHQ